MRTNTSSSIGLLLATGFLAPSVMGATIIYQDDFSGAATSLNGVAPDVGPALTTWTSGNLNANGAVTTLNNSSWLPVTVQNDREYTLTINSYFDHTATSTTRMYMGFTSKDPFITTSMATADSGAGLVLHIERDSGFQFAPGPGATTSIIGSSATTGHFTADGIVETKLVLTTSSTADWTIAGFIAGQQVDLDSSAPGQLYTIPATHFFRSTAPITGVGVSYPAASFVAEGFEFSVVPEPSTACLLAGVVGLVGRRSRRR